MTKDHPYTPAQEAEGEARDELEERIARDWPAIRERIDSIQPAPEATSDCPSEEEHFAALLICGRCPWCGQT